MAMESSMMAYSTAVAPDSLKKNLARKFMRQFSQWGSGLPDNGNLALGQAYDSF